MKILDIPQVGKIGQYVVQGGRYGQIKRAYVIPMDPKTPIQLILRRNLTRVTQSWRTLTQEERDFWTALALTIDSVPHGGTQGHLSGMQLYSKINCINLLCGNPIAVLPVARPVLGARVATAFAITNAAGAAVLKLATIGEPTQANPWIIRASAPQSAGCNVCDDLRIIGLAPAPENGLCDISALFLARYGVPSAGRKIWVSVSATEAGWQDLPSEFVATVPPLA